MYSANAKKRERRNATDEETLSLQGLATCESTEYLIGRNSATGRYRLQKFVMVCNDEDWCRSVFTIVADCSSNQRFGHLDLLFLGPHLNSPSAIQGVVFEILNTLEDSTRVVEFVRLVGITMDELIFAGQYGAKALIQQLKRAGDYPRTKPRRPSIPLLRPQRQRV